jgi:O-antigen/teichoic acid export membrane protein
MLIFLPSLMTSAIYPVLYQLGVSDKDRHRQTEEKVFKMLSAVGIPCSMLLCVLAAPITIWLYKGAFGQSIPVLMIVSWFLAFECMSFTLGDVLTTTDRQWQRAFVQGTALIRLYALTKLFYASWGIFGAAYAIMVIEVYIFIGYYILVRFGVYKIRIFRQLPLIIVSSAAMGFFAYLLRSLNPLLVCCLAGTVYLCLMGILDQDFRKVGIYLGKRSLNLMKK